jgi:hypothetical protein
MVQLVEVRQVREGGEMTFEQWGFKYYDGDPYKELPACQEVFDAAYNAGVAAERERCLAICSRFTVSVYDGDDIADAIREGK